MHVTQFAFKLTKHPEIEQAPFALPEDFTMLSAQTSADHNEAAHQKLIETLKEHGHQMVETDGRYGYSERLLMAIHNGTHAEKKRIEELAFKQFHQHSVIHSSNLKNKMVYQCL